MKKKAMNTSGEIKGRFSPGALRLSVAIRRAQELHPKLVDPKRFDKDPTYRMATMIYGKDHMKLADIPGKVLAEVVIRALDQVRYMCGHVNVPKKMFDDVLRDEIYKESRMKLPVGFSRETSGIYAIFHPQESNPAVPPPTVAGLEEYVGALVVIADTGSYMWLPAGNRLTEVTPDLLESIFEKDRLVAWFFLWGIKQFVESLVNEANRQLWLVTPLQDEVKNIIRRISLR